MQKPMRLLFENGQSFSGYGFGADAEAIAEVVFNTSMAGYQEILFDPSYCGQMVVMTYPLIGGYGMADEDYEARAPRLSGLIVREYNDKPSNFRCTRTLGDVMQEYGVPGIEGVDTRMIARMLRREGGMRALLTGADRTDEEGLSLLRAAPAPQDLVRRVSCKRLWYARTPDYRYHVVAIDLGVKNSVLQSLNARGCSVTIVPFDITAEEVLKLRPDGVLLTGGPGDPMDTPEPVALVRALQGKVPLFGIGLGHQIIALANGGATCRLKSPHRGGNHPVRELATGKAAITSQAHGYAVDRASLAGTPLSVTHEDLVDGAVEGLANEGLSVFSVQFQPEGAPGAKDSSHLFGRFAAMMEQYKGGAAHA